VTGDNDIWAVGCDDPRPDYWLPFMFHYDGSNWTQVDLERDGIDYGCPRKVVPLGPNDVWVIGTLFFAHWDGAHWSFPPETGRLGEPLSLWAVNSDDIWISSVTNPIVNPETHLFHWDGVDWTEVFPARTFFSMWGTRSDDIWAAGGGLMFHWDGTSWNPVDTGTDYVSSVTGGPDGVWAAGWSGIVRREP
jgi:hypothetical protein